MQTYHILLIEDDLSIVENLTAYLTAESFSVVSASGQDQALSLLETFHPDLVLQTLSTSRTCFPNPHRPSQNRSSFFCHSTWKPFCRYGSRYCHKEFTGTLSFCIRIPSSSFVSK